MDHRRKNEGGAIILRNVIIRIPDRKIPENNKLVPKPSLLIKKIIFYITLQVLLWVLVGYRDYRHRT